MIDREEDRFEQKLQRAMRRVDAPQGFAARVLQAAERPLAPVLKMPPRSLGSGWIAGAIAAALLVGAVGTGLEAEHVRKQREAERQFSVAMQATAHALEQTRQQLNRAGVRFGDGGND